MEKSAIEKHIEWLEKAHSAGGGDYTRALKNARRLAAEEKAKPTATASLPPNLVMGLTHLLCDVAQVFDGWHQDGTAWTEYDESVRKSVWHFQEELSRYQPEQSKDRCAELVKYAEKEIKLAREQGNGSSFQDGRIYAFEELIDAAKDGKEDK